MSTRTSARGKNARFPSISAPTRIHPSAVLIEPIAKGRGISIGPLAVVGAPYRRVANVPLPTRRKTRLGNGCEIGPHARILRGSWIGGQVSIDGGCSVEQDVDIGENSRLIYHCIVCNGAKIGSRCIIGGFIGERSKIGDESRIFGQLVHRQDDPAVPWDEQDEDPPVLEDHVFVGFGAIVVGNVRVGRRSCIGAGALVTRDVAPRSVVDGVNRAISYRDCKWKIARSSWFADA